MFKIFSTYVYLLNKYIKCNVWRLAVRYDPYMGVRLQTVNTPTLLPSHLCISVPSGQYPSGFPTRTLYVSLLPCACHMPRPSHPLFHSPNVLVHVIQLEIGRRFCKKKKKTCKIKRQRRHSTCSDTS